MNLFSVCRSLSKQGHFPALSGNVSFRSCAEEGPILISKSGISKSFLKSDDFVDLNSPSASIENEMHRRIYELTPSYNYVVHTHHIDPLVYSFENPTYSRIPPDILPELAISSTPNIPIVPYVLPGSRELATFVSQASARSKIVILSRHGIVLCSDQLSEILVLAERVVFITRLLSRLSNPIRLTGSERDCLRNFQR